MSTAWLCALGGCVMALGLAGAAFCPVAAGPEALAPFIVLCGLGFGLFQTPNNRSLFMAAPPDRSAAAGGAQGTARLTGQTAGAVLMTLILATLSLEAAAVLGLGLAAALTLTAGLISLLRGRQDVFNDGVQHR